MLTHVVIFCSVPFCGTAGKREAMFEQPWMHSVSHILFFLISEKEHVSNVIFSHKNAWLGMKVQVRHICYVYNNLHCYVYNIFNYTVMEITEKNSHCQKELFISGSSGMYGESRRGDCTVTPIAFDLIFSTTLCIKQSHHYVYNVLK